MLLSDVFDQFDLSFESTMTFHTFENFALWNFLRYFWFFVYFYWQYWRRIDDSSIRLSWAQVTDMVSRGGHSFISRGRPFSILVAMWSIQEPNLGAKMWKLTSKQGFHRAFPWVSAYLSWVLVNILYTSWVATRCVLRLERQRKKFLNLFIRRHLINFHVSRFIIKELLSGQDWQYHRIDS